MRIDASGCLWFDFCQLVEYVLEFHNLGLLPPSMTELDDFTDAEGFKLPSSVPKKPTDEGSDAGGGILGFTKWMWYALT